jgi:hypothetical protein
MSVAEPTPVQPDEVTAENVERVLAEHGCHGADFGIMSKAGEFIETFHSGKLFPGFKGVSDFPYDEVSRRLDGKPNHRSDTAPDTAAVLGMLLDWIKDNGEMRKDERVVNYIGRRAIAAIWSINPALFGGIAAHRVAEGYGFSAINFSRQCADFSRTFGIKNAFQIHDAKNKLPLRRHGRKPDGAT